MTGSARLWVAAYCALLTAVIVGPLAGSGYLLLRDAVSTPRSYLTDSALGLGAAAPRAVPQDALLAVLSPVVDGGILVKAILIVSLWAAGYGAAALARQFLGATTGPQLVAATLALWNPFVAERLLQGHWSLLAGYAALPWAALAAARLRDASTGVRRYDHSRTGGSFAASTGRDSTAPTGADRSRSAEIRESDTGLVSSTPRRLSSRADSECASGSTVSARSGVQDQRVGVGSWAALVAAFAAAGLTPTGSLLAAVIGLALVGRRNWVPAVALWVATCAPWLTATALGSGAEPSDPAGVSAFAARAEPWLGTLGSLAGLGGIWNGEAVPGSRTTPVAFVGTMLLLGIVALGVPAVWRRGRGCRSLLVVAAVAVVVPALGATSAGIAVGEWSVGHVPGAGLLRDSQKYVALAMPAYVLCAAAACTTVLAVVRRFARSSPDESASPDLATPIANGSPSSELDPTGEPAATTPRVSDTGCPRRSDAGTAAVATLFIGLLVLPLPDLAWGVGDEMRPVHYPAGWAEVVAHVDGPGDVAVLPAGMFRRFPYSGTPPVLDPAPRILPADVLQTGELRVRGYAVAGEGNRARTVETALLEGAPATDLAALGVGWILVERTTPGPLGASQNTLATTQLTYEDTDLALYRVPDPTPTDTATPTQRHLSTAAHLLWATLLAVALLTAAFRRNPH
ncbi:hypothetical protein [Nocardia caishijiensis]|uniref:Uncharacterized protein n=1 Tax=Nocardia caishijiensis TaxID=184756 RepID=A0ABQ6YU23_9NOCA|nr:hypothetical protein [Nocardia caishijiensis]KAF0849307.1 hypothetical protein FNL39_101745 [Nocardia caishijiensis]